VLAVYLAVKGVGDLEVEVAVVAAVGLAREGALDALVPLHRELLVQIEDGLPPVRVGRTCSAPPHSHGPT